VNNPPTKIATWPVRIASLHYSFILQRYSIILPSLSFIPLQILYYLMCASSRVYVPYRQTDSRYMSEKVIIHKTGAEQSSRRTHRDHRLHLFSSTFSPLGWGWQVEWCWFSLGVQGMELAWHGMTRLAPCFLKVQPTLAVPVHIKEWRKLRQRKKNTHKTKVHIYYLLHDKKRWRDESKPHPVMISCSRNDRKKHIINICTMP